MKLLKIITCLLCLFSVPTLAQNYVVVGGAAGSSSFSGVGSIHHDWQKNKLVFGTGLRLTGFFGKEVYFTSAPASLASTPSSVDTVFAPSPRMAAVNALVNIGYKITPKIELGFNIDVLGASFGPKGPPTYISNGRQKTVKAEPTKLNLLLVGNNDKGSLNSQFYGRYFINKKLGVTLAYQYLFNELTTETKIQTVPEENDRFRAKSSQVFAGLVYKL